MARFRYRATQVVIFALQAMLARPGRFLFFLRPIFHFEDQMQILPATLIASLLTIVSYGTAYPANSDETPYVSQQEHVAPVTITEFPGSDRFAPGVELKGAELHPSNTAAQASSIDDQQQASQAYAERRQRMIEQCEQNNGIRCAREVNTELRAEGVQRDTSEAYAERRQRMIEQCEQNNGIDCAREVDTELRAETIQRRYVVHTMRSAGGSR
jgi:hypothetical protein